MWWRRLRTWGNVLLALTAPLFAVFLPAGASTRGAIAAAWLVLGKTVLKGLEASATLRAANIQELYDTKLFHLDWNQALVGRQPVPDDVSSAARHIREQGPYLDWYSIDLGDTPGPAMSFCASGKAQSGAVGITMLMAPSWRSAAERGLSRSSCSPSYVT